MDVYLTYQGWWQALMAFLFVLVTLLGRKLLVDPSRRGRSFRIALAVALGALLLQSVMFLVWILRGTREMAHLPGVLVAISMCGLGWFLFIAWSRRWFEDPPQE